MSITDAFSLYSDAQALTGTAASTNLIDHLAAGHMGSGEPMALVLDVDVAADTASGNETYVVTLQTDDNSGFSSAATVATATIAGSALTAGSQHVLPIPPGVNVERYTRVNYTLGGTTPSVTLTARLAPMSTIATPNEYPDGITIS